MRELLICRSLREFVTSNSPLARTAPRNMGAPLRVKVAPHRTACLATNDGLGNSEPGAGIQRSSPDRLDDFALLESGVAGFIETTS
jgi:hypothetical protein